MTMMDDNELKEKGKTKKMNISTFEMLKYLSKIDILYLIIGIIGAISTGFAWPTMTTTYGDFIDVFVNFENDFNVANTPEEADQLRKQLMNDVLHLMAITMSIMAGFIVGHYIALYCFQQFAQRSMRRIKTIYFQSILRQEVGWYDEQSSGEFASRISNDFKKFENGINENIGMMIYNGSTMIFYLVYGISLGWKLALVILATAPITVVSTYLMTKFQTKYSTEEMNSYSIASSVAEEVISSIRTVFAFNGQQREHRRYETLLQRAMKIGFKRNFVTGLGSAMNWMILYGGFAIGIWYGVKLMNEEEENGNSETYSVGRIVSIFWDMEGVSYHLAAAAPFYETLQIARSASESIFKTIKRKTLIDPFETEGIKLNQSYESRLELQNIHFHYPTRPNIKVLNNFNLRINSGEIIALVGSSGCGKSTIIQLLQRFYDVEQGEILLDGNNLKHLNVGWLRQQMGIVGQEPILFDGTIEENIRLGATGPITMEDIIEVTKEANAHDFICKFTDGYRTNVGDRGAQLSGGQKQRIAIARALISKPRILLLDEATSALDLQSEYSVQMALDRASKGRTTIIVAHRLSTIRNADRIVYIHDGQVVEMGTHSQLIEQKGYYHQLVMAQSTDTKDDNDDEGEGKKMSQLKQHRTTISSTRSSIGTIEDPTMKNGEDENDYTNSSFPFQRLFKIICQHIWKDKLNFIIALIASIMFGFSTPAYALIFGSFVDEFTVQPDAFTNEIIPLEETIIKYSIYFLCLAFALLICNTIQIFLFGVVGEKLTMRLRMMAFGAILRQKIEWFDRPKNGAGIICSRLADDAANIQGVTGLRVSMLCQAISTLIVSVIISFMVNWQLALLGLGLMPFLALSSIATGNVSAQQAKLDGEASKRSSKLIIEVMNSPRTVVSLHKQNHFLDNFVNCLDNHYSQSVKKISKKSIIISLSFGAAMFAYGIMFLLGVVSSKQQQQKPMIKSNGNLSIRELYFTYESRPDQPVLNGLSFEARQGQTIALVGSSGCGKSTIIQLLEQFYQSHRGQILLDDNNMEHLETDWIRSQISLVSQEPNLFSYSIGENIAYGDNSRIVTEKEIIDAAMQANIDEFIRNLPNGYDTMIGSKGVQLSGGQRQRIAIARALIRNPSILLLDEATSALDADSESIVQSALEHASRGRTCIVVAHRLKTIVNSDRIIVIDKGRNVEQGTHQELLDKRGYYWRLYNVTKV
ncbi:Pgp-2p [Blomia tropicalis]|nr:Pgp-2p [Blomia tropicalis]